MEYYIIFKKMFAIKKKMYELFASKRKLGLDFFSVLTEGSIYYRFKLSFYWLLFSSAQHT